MSESGQNTRKTVRRWRMVRAAVGLLLAIWFARFAYVRVTTLPPGAAEAEKRAEAASVLGAELSNALDALPRFVPPGGAAAPATSAPAWGWGVDPGILGDGLRGSWEPTRRKHLRAIIQYLDSPKTARSLDNIAAVVERAWDMYREHGEPVQIRNTREWPSPSRLLAITALTVRARQRFATPGNHDSAIGDLLTAMRLQYLCTSDYDYYGALHAGTALREIMYICRETDIPRFTAAPLFQILRDEVPFSISEAILASLDLRRGVDALLDRMYTRDANGDGWLVISHAGGMGFSLRTGQGRRPASRWWNIFSPLFNDRRTTAAKWKRFIAELSQIDAAGASALETNSLGNDLNARFNITDGPWAVGLSQGRFYWALEQMYEPVARRRAALIMLALSAYRHDNGTYPQSLAALVPDYLAEVPLDILTARPFDYQFVSDGANSTEQEYSLRSIGHEMFGHGARGTSSETRTSYTNPRETPQHDTAGGGS